MRETHAGLPRQLVLYLKQARNFVERDIAPSAYCVLTMQEQEFKSEVVRKTHVPAWNGEFRFDLVGVEVDLSVVQFSVWDKGVLKDDFLGQCSIPVSEALKRSKQELVLPLQPRPGQAGDLLVGGELVVKFEAEMAELHMDGEVDLTQFDWYHGNLSGTDAYKVGVGAFGFPFFFLLMMYIISMMISLVTHHIVFISIFAVFPSIVAVGAESAGCIFGAHFGQEGWLLRHYVQAPQWRNHSRHAREARRWMARRRHVGGIPVVVVDLATLRESVLSARFERRQMARVGAEPAVNVGKM